MRISFRTLLNEKIQHIDMKSFNFSSDTPSLVLDLNHPLSGDAALHFKEYTHEINREFILRMTKFYTLPKNFLNALIRHQYISPSVQE